MKRGCFSFRDCISDSPFHSDSPQSLSEIVSANCPFSPAKVVWKKQHILSAYEDNTRDFNAIFLSISSPFNDLIYSKDNLES